MGRLQTLSCQPSSKLPFWYRHRTPAPAGLGDVVRSILMEASAGPKMVQGITATPRAGGDPLLSPHSIAGPRGYHAWHLCSGGSEGPALPVARSRDMVAACCSMCLVPAVRPAMSGTAACSSPGSDCPACISTAHAHLGGATGEQHSWAGVSPCAKGDPVGQPSLAIDLT